MNLSNLFKIALCLLVTWPLVINGQCVGDQTNPVAICKNITVYYYNNSVTVYPADIDNGSSDNCGIETMLINGSNSLSFDCLNIGINSVTLTVIDSASNNASCVANVIVLDTTSPVAICQNFSVYLNQSGQAVLYPSDINSGSYDNCGIFYSQINYNDSLILNASDTGLNSVLLHITDPSGNINSCSSFVTVIDSFNHCNNDTISPVAACNTLPMNISLGNSGVANITPQMIDAGSSDNCGIDYMLVNGLSSWTLSCINQGLQNVVLTVIDESGNSSQCIASVLIYDTTAPVAFCQNIQVYLDSSGQAIVSGADINDGSTDVCGISNYLINGNASYTYNSTDTGLNIAVLSVVDLAGNISTCISTVMVLNPNNSSMLSGNVFEDLNYNCQKDSVEQFLRNIIIVAAGQNTYYESTDAQGNYTFHLDSGNYIVYPVLPSPYWTVCLDSQQVYVPDATHIDTIDFAMQATGSCPYLQVDIAAPFLRKVNSSFYTVSYCNQGTSTATNSTVEVDIDPDLTVLSSSIPVVSQNGSVYVFNVGDVAVNQCGSFQIFVMVNNSALNGQTHCSEAMIYPDTICLDPWSGAILRVDVLCNNDTVKFTIFNEGPSAVINKSYTIIEDHVIMITGNTGVINSGDSAIVYVPAIAEKAYRLMVDQDANFPSILGSPVATAAIEGCVKNSSGGFNTGFITQFNNDNSSPFIAVDCQQNIGSYDPNDKSAQPRGYDDNFHYIDQHTVLDYRIRFQNTGTDTAFNVVIIDTLANYLNVESLKMGASSHPYEWSIKEQGVLEVTFTNIMLPDSNTNEPLSHGFFNFEIEQTYNNPLGLTINNQAEIYFDLNTPVATNTTFHTVEEDYITVLLQVQNQLKENIDMAIYPNPFNDKTTIDITGREFENLSIHLTDISGREQRAEYSVQDNLIHLSRGQLSPGVYIIQVRDTYQTLATGKLIVR